MCNRNREKEMKHKLDILVPHYKESFEVVKPLLDSIQLQQSVNFDEIGVIIVNDGDEVVLDQELFKNYSFDIKYYVCEHSGVSETRNRCLDYSKAEYVMWCDADDMFYNNVALWVILEEIGKSHFDTLASAFVEEVVDRSAGKHSYIIRGGVETGGMDCTFVHGKVHKRKYLKSKNIRWNKDLKIHEDSYFNILCQRLANQVAYIPVPFYLWKWRDDSVCRHDPLYMQKTYTLMLDSSTALIEQFLARNKEEFAKYYATSMIFDAYYTMNTDVWLKQENKEYRKNTEKRFKDYYLKFKDLFESIDLQTKHQIVAAIRNRFFTQGLLLETQTFDQWIKHILKL